MQTPTAMDYAAITPPGTIFSKSPGRESTVADKAGWLNGFSVSVRSAVLPFFQSLSPDYQQLSVSNKSVSYDSKPVALNSQSMLNEVCQGTGMVAQLVGAWVPEVKVLADVASKICVAGSLGGKVIECMQEKYAARGELSEPKKCTSEKYRAASSAPRGALAAAAMVSMGQIAVSDATPEPTRTMDRPIPVPNRETLAQIGQNDRYPLSGHYVQTQDIDSDVSIGNEDQPFYGHYDGGCHTISGQSRCLFGKLAEHGVVSNLRLAQAHVEGNDKYSAVVVCKMGEGSRLENLQIEHSSVLANGNGFGADPPLAMAHAGVITAHQQENSHIGQIEVNNCSVSSTGKFASVAIVSAWNQGDAQQLTVKNSRVTSGGSHSRAGIGAGVLQGRIDDLTVLDSQVKTAASYSFAGIGGGVINDGGKLEKLTVVNSSVSTTGDGSDAGIGAGKTSGTVLDTRAIDCSVKTSGEGADAGIGAGSFEGGRTVGIIALRSDITASGKKATAGIGAGSFGRGQDRVNHPSVINMTNSVQGVNVTVNGRLQNVGNMSQPYLNQLCVIADQRFVASDCRVMNQSA